VSSGWFSPMTLGGIVVAAAFAVLCYRDLRKGIVFFTAAGCIRGVQVGAFSGSEMVQGLLPVEVLATVLIGVWIMRRASTGLRIGGVGFNLPLLLLIPSSLLSLVVGFTWFDPKIAVDHMKVAVSIGQILIALWVIGIYLVVADTVRDDRTIAAIRRVIVLLAIPSLALVVSPQGAWRYVEWSTTFALPASSLCFAEFFETRSMVRRAALLFITVAPIVYGFATGKAFFYAYVIVSSSVIAWLKAKRLLILVAPLAFAAYVVAVPLASGSLTPEFLREAVETEESQQSLGGDGGRDQLIRDSLTIWSKYPVFGVGPGNNYPYMLRYSTLGTAHNQFMNILIELGVVGLAFFLWFTFRATRLGLAVWKTAQTPLHRSMALAWIGLFAGMCVGGMFGDFMIPSIRNDGLNLLSLFYVQWILLGILVSISHLGGGRVAAM
jgi:hypothetical protein